VRAPVLALVALASFAGCGATDIIEGGDPHDPGAFRVELAKVNPFLTAVPTVVREGEPLVLDLAVEGGPLDEACDVAVEPLDGMVWPPESSEGKPGEIEVNAWHRTFLGVQDAVLDCKHVRREVCGLRPGPYVIRFNVLVDRTRPPRFETVVEGDEPHLPPVRMTSRRVTEVWQATVDVVAR
jgi:hypothetical protein